MTNYHRPIRMAYMEEHNLPPVCPHCGIHTTSPRVAHDPLFDEADGRALRCHADRICPDCEEPFGRQGFVLGA